MPSIVLTATSQGSATGHVPVGGTLLACIQENDADTKYIYYSTAPLGGTTYFFDGLPGAATAVSTVKVYYYLRKTAAVADVWYGRMTMGGVHFKSAAQAAPTTSYDVYIIEYPTDVNGDPWTPTTFRNTEFGVWGGSCSSGEYRWTFMLVEPTYTAIPRYIEMIRDILSRTLRYRSRSPKSVRLAPFLSMAAWPPLTDVAVSHHAFAPAGAGVERAARHLLALTELTLDVDRMEVSHVGLLYLSRFRVADWDTCYSPEDAHAPDAQGVARLSRGARVLTRASSAYAEDPVDRRIIEVAVDTEKRSADGLILETARTQANTRSSFKSQLTGVTLAGTGINGSAITAVSDELWFDSPVSGYSMKMLAGNPHTTDLTARFADTASYAANSRICVWARYRTETEAEGLKLRIQRMIDSWYWNDGTEAWQAGAVDVEFAVSTTRTKAATKPIDVGGGATAIRVTAVIPSGGTASRIARVFHVQIENGPYPTSDIVADNAAVTRASDALTLTNNFGARTVPNDHGTARLKIKPLWNAADLAAGDVRVFFDAYYDASNYQRLFYDKTTGQLIFRRRVGGVNFDATIAWTPVREQEYDLAARWAGPEGELGLAAYTLSVFVDGVKGTDAVASGAIHPTPANATLYVAHDQSGANQADCYYLLRETVERVLSDEEMVDL